MATYRVLYWQEIPAQIKAEDDDTEVSLELDKRFAERIDEVAHARGADAADDYLAHWKWSDELDRDGTAREVAESVKAELEASHTW